MVIQYITSNSEKTQPRQEAGMEDMCMRAWGSTEEERMEEDMGIARMERDATSISFRQEFSNNWKRRNDPKVRGKAQ